MLPSSKIWILLLGMSLVFCLGCTPSANPTSSPGAAPAAELRLLQVPAKPDGLPILKDIPTDGFFEHDRESFTQGLLFHDGFLFESTGRFGKSKVRKLDPESGEILSEIDVDKEFFCEGLAVLDDTLYQLTWRSGVCHTYNLQLEPQKQLFYGTEGWGLAVQPETKLLVFSDGTPNIRFCDPTNFIAQGRITVTDGNDQPVQYLNELEWVNGEIWANIWTSATIARIDPKTGHVKGWLDFTQLTYENQTSNEDVLNGIAYDSESDTIWLTGKMWSRVYRINNVKEKFFEHQASSE